MHPTGLGSVLELWLMIVSSVLKEARGQALALKLDRGNPSCGKDMLEGVDFLKISGTIDYQKSNKKLWPRYVTVRIGDPDTSFTTSCKPRTGPGCYCTEVDSAQSVFTVHVQFLVAANMSGSYVQVAWPSKSGPSREWMEKIGKVYGQAYPTLSVNICTMELKPNSCRLTTLQNSTSLYYCVKQLKNPRISLSYDHDNVYTFYKECVTIKVRRPLLLLEQIFYFSYSDDCHRNVTIMCMYPHADTTINTASLSSLTPEIVLVVITAGYLVSGMMISE